MSFSIEILLLLCIFAAERIKTDDLDGIIEFMNNLQRDQRGKRFKTGNIFNFIKGKGLSTIDNSTVKMMKSKKSFYREIYRLHKIAKETEILWSDSEIKEKHWI